MDPQEQKFVDGLDATRRRLMQSQGLFLLRTQVSKQRPGGWFRWLKQPVEDVPDDAVWYVDGSLYDGPSKLLGVTGYAIVVVARDGRLLGCASGAPPHWITTAGAAEAYATYKVLALSPFVPHIVTDCLGVLQTLQRGPTAASAANKLNARLWALIGGCLDGTTWQAAADHVTWMPSHGTKGSIGNACKSDGGMVTATDWRANRLADALAKAAAGRFRVPSATRNAVTTALRAYEQSAAVAGIVTYAANNFCLSTTAQDGTYVHKRLRDAQPPATRHAAERLDRGAEAPAQATRPTTPTSAATALAAPLDLTAAAPALTSAASTAPAAARTSHSAKAACLRADAARDARAVRSWHQDMAARPRLAAQGPTAQERLAALRLRVCLRHSQAGGL